MRRGFFSCLAHTYQLKNQPPSSRTNRPVATDAAMMAGAFREGVRGFPRYATTTTTTTQLGLECLVRASIDARGANNRPTTTGLARADAA